MRDSDILQKMAAIYPVLKPLLHMRKYAKAFEEIDSDDSNDVSFEELLAFIREKAKRVQFEEELKRKIENALPSAVRKMLTTMSESFQFEQLFFVHAGVDPRYSLSNQTLEAKTWIRDEFLNVTTWPFNEIIIHGHSIEHFSKKTKKYLTQKHGW